MRTQALATVAAYVLAVASLACTIVWVVTDSWAWLWPASFACIGAVTLVAWLWRQPLPHERRGSRDP